MFRHEFVREKIFLGEKGKEFSTPYLVDKQRHVARSLWSHVVALGQGLRLGSLDLEG